MKKWKKILEGKFTEFIISLPKGEKHGA